MKIGPENQSKDVACNLSVMFSIREMVDLVDKEGKDTNLDNGVPAEAVKRYLDITVTNRSNDMIWGTLGANYVHFSFLQEYVANCLGVEVGVYNQFTNNLHVYTSRWEPEKWLSWYTSEAATLQKYDYYGEPVANADIKLVSDKKEFDCIIGDITGQGKFAITVGEEFLDLVAAPLLTAFGYHKQRNYEAALESARKIAMGDWRVACVRWLKRREANYLKKEAT
jgi:hypothetical protein